MTEQAPVRVRPSEIRGRRLGDDGSSSKMRGGPGQGRASSLVCRLRGQPAMRPLSRSARALSALLVSVALGCSGGGSPAGGSGGSGSGGRQASGGATGSGGAGSGGSNSGGAPGSGGHASGGAPGSGGHATGGANSGGIVGSGGIVATGGREAFGGRPGSGGSSSGGAGGAGGRSETGGHAGGAGGQGRGTGGAGGGSGAGGSAGSFAAVLAIFQDRCVNCHDASKQGLPAYPGLSLTPADAHAALVGHPADETCGGVRVVAGDPASSYLLHKVSEASPCDGSQMPARFEALPAPPLTADQIATLTAWIAAGAPN